jgi:hypothetical protein
MIGHNGPPADLLTDGDVFRELDAAVEQAGGQRLFALAHGLTASLVNDVLHARRPVSPLILAALGLRKVERYSRLSISPRRIAGASVAAQIAAAIGAPVETQETHG